MFCCFVPSVYNPLRQYCLYSFFKNRKFGHCWIFSNYFWAISKWDSLYTSKVNVLLVNSLKLFVNFSRFSEWKFVFTPIHSLGVGHWYALKLIWASQNFRSPPVIEVSVITQKCSHVQQVLVTLVSLSVYLNQQSATSCHLTNDKNEKV